MDRSLWLCLGDLRIPRGRLKLAILVIRVIQNLLHGRYVVHEYLRVGLMHDHTAKHLGLISI